jgi:hypothetical protein
MPVITPWNIFTPDQTTGLTPLADKFRQMAQSVSDALTSIAGGTSRKASSATARDTLYPPLTVVQGDSVFRTDLGYVERYYGTYNSTSNPGGATPAGWYPEDGAGLNYYFFRPATDSWSTNTETAVMGLTVTVPAGRYEVSGDFYASAATPQAGNAILKVNGAQVANPPLDFPGSGSRQSIHAVALYSHAGGSLALSASVLAIANGSSKSIYQGSALAIKYVGRRI